MDNGAPVPDPTPFVPTNAPVDAATDVELSGDEDTAAPKELFVGVNGFRATSYKVGQRFRVGPLWWEVKAVRSEPPLLVMAPSGPGMKLRTATRRRKRR